MEFNSSQNIVLAKSKDFALRIIKLYNHLTKNKTEYIISKQIFRCGTSIGANIAESVYAQSHDDFISKLSIALKEASETKYWLELLFEAGYIEKAAYESIYSDCIELIKILTSIVKTSKEKRKTKP